MLAVEMTSFQTALGVAIVAAVTALVGARAEFHRSQRARPLAEFLAEKAIFGERRLKRAEHRLLSCDIGRSHRTAIHLRCRRDTLRTPPAKRRLISAIKEREHRQKVRIGSRHPLILSDHLRPDAAQ